jgi:hypothetical protein
MKSSVYPKTKNINIWMEESSKEVKHCLHKLYTHKRISISSRESKKKNRWDKSQVNIML